MKKYLFGALCVLSSLAGGSVFAQEGSGPSAVEPSTLVTVTDIQSTIADAIGPWISAGLGIGIAVFCVYLGWRLIKRFTR